MPEWSWVRNSKNPAPSPRDLSPNAEALARIRATLAYVFSSESPDGRERSVPDLVSHLVASYRQLHEQYRDLRTESNGLKDEKTTLERMIQTSREEIQNQWNEREKQVALCQTEINRLKNEKTTLERMIQTSKEQAQAQRHEWGNREALHQVEVNGLKDIVERLRQSDEEANRQISIQLVDLDKARKANQQAQEQLQQSHEKNVEDIQKQNATREAGLKAKYEISERQMKEDHTSAVRHLRGEVESLERDREKRKTESDLEKMQLKESHKVKQDKLKEKYDAHESQLKKTHKQQQERLQKDVRSRNKALIARESYSPITDGELKSMFSSLVRKLDNLARLKWTMNQSPWPDEELNRISDTPKRLQKQIMKETIWDILYEQVFCSPFRIFGPEGSILESEWNKAFRNEPETEDEHYTWPEPSFDAERWRYETMRQGQEALKVETSEYDPRTKLRKGFQSSLETIFERLSGVLKMVSEVDEKTKVTIKDVANEAANTCVAFGTQRCRIVVAFKDLKTVEEFKEGPEREDQFVDLLTQPELRRIGDADGESLDKEPTVVAGCEGEIKRFCY